MFKKFLALVAMCLGIAGTAHSTTISTETWYLGAFGAPGSAVTGAGFGAGGAIDPGAPAWTFSVADDHTLRVFDCCALGDVFEVFDFGVSLGMTTVGTSTCFDIASCSTGSGLSRGDFVLGAGAHSITMTFVTGPGSGNLFFVVNDTADPVPEPATLALTGLALGAAGFLRRRRAVRA